jgi:DNA helicase-2/ATP-dependent DNA helicase PcrA
MGVSEFVNYVMERSGLLDQYQRDLSDEGKNRLENLQEFLAGVTEYESASPQPSLEDYLENIALVSDLDNADFKAPAVTLMTIHSAKGLEFPTVFLTGLEEGLFPSKRSFEGERLEEERRLCYVAVTRAMRRLYLSYAAQRMQFNQINYNAPSRFLKEIPTRLLDDHWVSKREKNFPGVIDSYSRPTPKRVTRHTIGTGLGAGRSALGIAGVQKGFTPSAAASVPADQVAVFKPGDRVMHRKFGEGNVLEIHGTGNDARIVIGFTAYGSKEFALSIAPIVKVNE